jgi:hypothetical protein
VFAKRAAIAALERVATSDGDFAAGRRFLAGVDPLARGRAARLMRAAHLDALASTRVRGAHADAHAARLACLALLGRGPAVEIVDDIEATRAAFEDARRGARVFARWLWPFTLLAVAVVAGLGFGVTRVLRATSTRSIPGGASSRPAPPSGGAFAAGGAPETNPIVQHALAVDLPAFLIALDRVASAGSDDEVRRLRGDADAAELRATAPEVRAALGAEAAKRFGELLSAARRASNAGAAQREAEADALLEATAALDDALASKGLGYFLDGDVIVEGDSGRRHVIIYAFEVLRVGVFESRERVLSLELRRIDRLNWSHALLGFTRPQLRSALVLLDMIDRQLVSTILLGLAPDGTVPLFDRGDTSVTRELVRKVEGRAGEIVREDYGDPRDAATTARLGTALARRGNLFDGWQKALAARGMSLTLPGALHVEGNYHADLGAIVPAPGLTALDEIEETLREPAVEEAFVSARGRLVASIERHEVQHRLDFMRSEPLGMPAALERWVGPLEANGRERRGAERARSEMSAYLAQLARDEGTTKADTILALRFLLDQKMQGIPECYAALAILEGLADELAIPIDGPLVENGNISRQRAALLILAVLDKPAEAIRAASKRVWEKSFRSELAPLRRLPSP